MNTKIFFLCAAPLLFSGCVHSSAPSVEKILDGRKADYRRGEYQEGRELKYPPNIISSLDPEQSGSQLLSEYRIEAVPDISAPEEVEFTGERKVSYRRDGNLRWIDMDLSPNEAFGLVLRFWEELNFQTGREDLELGTVETEWLDLEQAPATIGLGGYLDELLNRVRDSGKRDKFISRVEPRGEYASVFVAHRHAAAQFNADGQFSGFAPLPADSQLEAEILRRMMIYASRAPEAEQQTAFAEEIAEAEENSDYELDGTRLLIRKPFEESWLLVRIGLDRGGFTIEDQDYIERAYYIRHTGGPESSQIFGKNVSSIVDTLLGRETTVSRDIKITLNRDGESTLVLASALEEDEPLTEKQASVLLELLSDNLP
ncbi:MAG: outer membrane protein assembly factor BamC [Gammaproteobacteria bacterium]